MMIWWGAGRGKRAGAVGTRNSTHAADFGKELRSGVKDTAERPAFGIRGHCETVERGSGYYREETGSDRIDYGCNIDELLTDKKKWLMIEKVKWR